MKSLKDKFWEKVKKTKTCWLWKGAKNNQTGYGVLGSSKTRHYGSAHRISWKLHKGYIPSKMCVCHKCDVRLCIRPSHLFLGTRRDNLMDMKKKNRHWHKLSRNSVTKIMELSKKFSHRLIAKQFSISHTMVNDIVKGTWWKL